MTEPSASCRRIGIIGGGASGVMLAANLLRNPGLDAEIILIDRREDIGRGLAYSTWDPTHLLNVRVGNMSAFKDEPDHFLEWLDRNGPRHGVGCPTRFCFVPRLVYGDYLSTLLKSNIAPDRLHIIQDECIAIERLPEGVSLGLASDRKLRVDVAVLATGNEVPPQPLTGRGASPWQPGVLDAIDPLAPVLLVGTGLTMVDTMLSLQRRGHRGAVIAISRRGLLPQAHRLVLPSILPRSEVPFGRAISHLLRWVRGLVRLAARESRDWRSVIDALRPHTQDLWKAMSLDQRCRFLRHARPWWDVYRHRMAPQVADQIANLIAAGRLRILSARVVAAQHRGNAADVTLRLRGGTEMVQTGIAAILNCTGLPDDLRDYSNPAIASLYQAGLARSGPLGIGLDLDPAGALIGADATISPKLYAVGPLTRGVVWESVAIPDICDQCANLSDHLLRHFWQQRL